MKIERLCNNCETKLKRPYRINIYARNPEKTYQNSNLPFVNSETRMYCKVCFKDTLKRILKLL